MKTKNYTILMLLVLSLLHSQSKAQSTIDNINMPKLGEKATIKICSDAIDMNTLKAEAGAMKVWDYSGLQEKEEQSFDFKDPSTGLSGSEFPAATLVGVSWDAAHSYYEIKNNEIAVVGQVFPISSPTVDTAKMTFTNSEVILKFPSNYNDNFHDSFEGTSKAVGFTIPFTGGVTVKADGYGTLKTPAGTFNNVIRYYVHRVQKNSIMGAAAQVKDQWFWVSADHSFWIMLMENTFDGFSNSELVWYNKAPNPIAASVKNINVSEHPIYPNPCGANEEITVYSPNSEQKEISIYNNTGLLISQSKLWFTTGENAFKLPENIQTKGIYTIEIKGQKDVQRQRLMMIK